MTAKEQHNVDNDQGQRQKSHGESEGVFFILHLFASCPHLVFVFKNSLFIILYLVPVFKNSFSPTL